MVTRPYAEAPDLAAVDALARQAIGTIPEPLRQHVRNVVIQVRDFPDDATLDEMDCETPFDLLGLYRGIALGEKGVSHVPHDVDLIFLYRRPILDYWCETGEDLAVIVRHVIIHEIGHHFGFSDEDMERMEAEA
ncbi:MAG: metallopeptidase family protein [Geminicoccales bacterium]